MASRVSLKAGKGKVVRKSAAADEEKGSVAATGKFVKEWSTWAMRRPKSSLTTASSRCCFCSSLLCLSADFTISY
ncbi:hypothetical protein SASPL_143612 [Salvia splendens]|uniref:Uncharacterized protein n=1 Tax=Salvia splendens TaxID=180675 RepID=A0A8X8WMZ0_SALSN|nr:hypothetical protein SASPL_143612 [Salvia splendens]